jgi:hypothetical protein
MQLAVGLDFKQTINPHSIWPPLTTRSFLIGLWCSTTATTWQKGTQRQKKSLEGTKQFWSCRTSFSRLNLRPEIYWGRITKTGFKEFGWSNMFSMFQRIWAPAGLCIIQKLNNVCVWQAMSSKELCNAILWVYHNFMNWKCPNAWSRPIAKAPDFLRYYTTSSRPCQNHSTGRLAASHTNG